MLFFRNKFSRAIDPKAAEQRWREKPLELEKGDLPAILLAALITLGPVFLVMIGVLLGLWWWFGG